MARLYQKIDGEAVPLGGGGGSSVDIDNITITKNSSTNKIQVADAITSKVNELNNAASDVGKILTANGDGTASWENGYVEGFYGTTAVWNALSYAQQKEWIQKNPKVTFTDDYVSNIKQTVDGCMSSTNENDVVGASAINDLIKQSTTEKVVGTDYRGKTIYQCTFNGTISTYTDATARRAFTANILQNVDTIENLKGWYSINNNPQKYSANSPFVGSAGEFLRMGTVYIQNDIHELRAFVGTLLQDNVTSVEYHFVVDYTKVTD